MDSKGVEKDLPRVIGILLVLAGLGGAVVASLVWWLL